jgi:mono/diheme cytochrome c family protein
MIPRLPPCLVLCLAVAGCGDHSMSQQNRYGVMSKAALFSDGKEAQALPEGVVSQADPGREEAVTKPPAVDAALLARGQERYNIYCTPCHGATGRGDGMIVQRGFPAPPSYHIDRLRAADKQHFFDVITNGYGVMYSYAARVEPRDRWAIVAYIRALQQSQHVNVAEVPELRSKLP